MLREWQNHAEFQDQLRQGVIFWSVAAPERLRFYAPILYRVYLLNLDPAREVLAPAHPTIGRPCERQAQLLRALFVMTFLGEPSLTRLVQRLHAEPMLALACGFRTGDIPGIGSFYAFQHRVWPGYHGPRKKRRLVRPGQQLGSGEKLKERRPGVIQRLVNQALAGRRLTRRPERFLQELLASVAVLPSAALGLLGKLDQLDLALDGAPLETGAAPSGRRTCACKSRRCNCSRRYSDPEANWGWDSYHKRWFYGHTLYHVTAAQSPHDLPILVRLVQGSRHDGVTGVIALTEAYDLYRDFSFRQVLADAAHDAQAFYQLCYTWHLVPLSAENPRNRTSPYQPITELNPEGRPICPAGKPMIRDGYDRHRQRVKWRCPWATRKQKPESQPCACSPSPYGRVVYTYPAQLERQPPIPRGSEQWREAYKRRTTVERSLKRTLVDYAVERGRVRGKCHWMWRVTLAAIAQHVDAWMSQLDLDVREFLQVA